MPSAHFDVGFIGTGSMGGMLVRAFLRAGVVQAENIWAANRTPQKLAALAAKFCGIHCDSPSRVAQQSEVLFLAVKPGDTEKALESIENNLRPDQLCVFLTNVFSLEQLERRIPCAAAKLIPTITQQINQGVALIAYGQRAASEHFRRMEALLSATCRPLIVEERHMRLFGDITSCGPALLAVCLEELCRQASAIDPSIPSRDVLTACVETLAATGELLRTGITPEQLVGEVAVPGGMTEAGISALRQLLPQLFSTVFSATRQTEQQKRQSLSLG
jgi:competence protein ComER